MAIAFACDVRKQPLASIRQCVAESLDQDLGALEAGVLLDDDGSSEIGPVVYNQAIQNALHSFQERDSSSR